MNESVFTPTSQTQSRLSVHYSTEALEQWFTEFFLKRDIFTKQFACTKGWLIQMLQCNACWNQSKGRRQCKWDLCTKEPYICIAWWHGAGREASRYTHSLEAVLPGFDSPPSYKLSSRCFTGRVIHQCVCCPSDKCETANPVCRRYLVDVKDPMVSFTKSWQACQQPSQLTNSCPHLGQTSGLANQFMKDLNQTSPGQPRENMAIIVAVNTKKKLDDGGDVSRLPSRWKMSSGTW